jgi:iron complex transport system substrate-binding protein
MKDQGISDDISAYYTLGPTGLMTDPAGSKHTQIFDFLEIPNAAKIDIPSGGHAKVDMEQIISWNPDYIFAAYFKGGINAKEHIETSPLWADIEAVKSHRVYEVPGIPFSWFDHPPSANRIPGLIWLCHIFYGQEEIVTREKIQRFYALFYHYDLCDEEYYQLVNN